MDTEPEFELDISKLETDSEENPYTAKFKSFIETQYLKEIEKLANQWPHKKSLSVDFKELERFDFEVADELLEHPDLLLEAAEMAASQINVPAFDIKDFKPHVRFYNLPKDRTPYLRNIGSEHLGKLICVEGLVRQVTDVLPKLRIAAWQCRRCANIYKKEQETDKISQPMMCECRHREFSLLAEQSTFMDSQKILVQEPLELLKGSEQATNFEIMVTDDQVNKILPGDRTKITGIVRLKTPKEKGLIYQRFLDANHLEETQKEFEEIQASPEETEAIKALSQNPKIYDMLIQSIAPNIYGHSDLKEAIALQLFGGIAKVLPNDSKIRGNIHVLLVGDPGTAKSQLLQSVNKIAPKSVYVAGKTSTGAGLTASAVKDDFGEGTWTLKAGALVLANGGMAMVDEFDKMDTEDRSAMHEAMEQGMISVAKAGIVTRLKTETTILAAANPKFSRFDQFKNFFEQIDLPPTLISRFDLFFMIRDVLDRKRDEELASHILKIHQTGAMLRHNKASRTKNTVPDEGEKRITPQIDSDLLKKYVAYARQNAFPVLTKEAIQAISEYYVNLREQGKKEGTYSATHRQLEGLVRLSEASARIRLSDTVDEIDAGRAIRLLRTSLQELVTDKETGRIDIDMITSGQTANQTQQLKTVLNIVKTLALEHDKVLIEQVLEEAKTAGIDKEKTRELIGKLKRTGDLYEPSHGILKAVNQRE
jgi:replicative DNA helicase Mcm